MEYLHNIIFESDFEAPADTRTKLSDSSVYLCVTTWAATGLFVGGFWYGVFSVACKLIT